MLNELLTNYKKFCRTAPATPGLLNTLFIMNFETILLCQTLKVPFHFCLTCQTLDFPLSIAVLYYVCGQNINNVYINKFSCENLAWPNYTFFQFSHAVGKF